MSSITDLLLSLLFFFSFCGGSDLIQEPMLRASALKGTVNGTVLDGEGKPLAAATVYAVPESDLRAQFHTMSNKAGNFTLRDLPEGTLNLDAYKESEGYPYDFFSFFASPGENVPVKIQIRAGEEMSGVRIQLGKRFARLNIAITQNGKPFESGATLYFSRPDQPGRPYNRGARSEESLLVPPIPFHVMVQAKGYWDWNYGGNPSALLTLKPGEVFNLTVRLKASQ